MADRLMQTRCERAATSEASTIATAARDEARVRLADEEREHDEAARTRLASSMVDRPIVDRYIQSDYLMSVRFNRLLDVIDDEFGLSGRTLLSCGCGAGIYEIAFAKRGANVFAYDISGGMLEIARHNAATHDAAVTFFKADEYELAARLVQLDAPRFDLVFGASILHHLADPDAFLCAIGGACSDDAAAVFLEPLATPLVERVRQSRLNPARRHQTQREHVWSRSQYMTLLERLFDTVEMRSSLGIASGVHRALAGSRWARRINPSAAAAIGMDDWISRVPGAGVFAWHGTFIAKRFNPGRLVFGA